MARPEHKRDLVALLRQLQAQGWTVEQTARGHYRCVPPLGGGKVVFVGGSGDRRAIHNARTDLRRNGARL
jgi:hypothetical protein